MVTFLKIKNYKILKTKKKGFFIPIFWDLCGNFFFVTNFAGEKRN